MNDQVKDTGGMSRKSTLILVLSMFGVAVLIDLRSLFGGVPFPSVQNTAGSLVANTLLFFGLFSLSLRYLEDKSRRIEGVVMLVLMFIMFGILVATYLSLH